MTAKQKLVELEKQTKAKVVKVKVLWRLPKPLHTQLKRSASKNNVTVNDLARVLLEAGVETL